MRPNIKVQSGNRVIVLLDGQQVGLIQSVRMADNYGLEDASGIGDIHVQENVPTIAHHTLNVSAMVLKKANLRSAGIFTLNGDGALLGLIFDIQVIDKDTNAPLRTYIGCSYDSGDSDVTKHAIVMQSGVMKALDVRDTGV